MGRLIDAKKLKRAIMDMESPYSTFFIPDWVRVFVNRVIDKAPTVDAEPVRHGHWIEKGAGFNWHFECSACGWEDGYPFNDRMKYCPNCGAKMDEEAEECE